MNSIDKNDIENNLQSQSDSLITPCNEKDNKDVKLNFYKNLSNQSKTLVIYSNYIIVTALNVISFLALKMNDVKQLHAFLIVFGMNILSFLLTFKEIYNSKKC